MNKCDKKMRAREIESKINIWGEPSEIPEGI